MHQFCADIPVALHEADDLLTRYGRWAAPGGYAKTCGSAEGKYRPGAGEALEGRRIASAVPLTADQLSNAQKALQTVPDKERVVLSVLYVPRPMSVQKQLVLMGIPTRLVQQRHLLGLRMWWNNYRLKGR